MNSSVKNKIKIAITAFILICITGVIVYQVYLMADNRNKKKVAYSKETNTSYVTYLKNNNHYNSKYLKDEYNYVPNLIDYFNLDYNYTYTLSEDISYTLNYEIVGSLDVYDSENDSKPVERRTYQFLDKVEKESHGSVINVNVLNQKIDYGTYSKIIQEWKKEISPNANLRVTLNVKWSGYSETLGKEITDNFSQDFNIPISDKTITVSNPNNISNSGYFYGNYNLSKSSLLILGISGVLFIILFIILIILIRKVINEKSKYERKISKILREFDRAITEAKGSFVKNDKDFYVEVNDFMELMDVHDNLNEPIIFYRNTKNESVFVVRNKKDIYYWKIKRKDYE